MTTAAEAVAAELLRLPDPDTGTARHYEGQGEPAYTPELVAKIQRAAFLAGVASLAAPLTLLDVSKLWASV